jgi:hypothetical protein
MALAVPARCLRVSMVRKGREAGLVVEHRGLSYGGAEKRAQAIGGAGEIACSKVVAGGARCMTR